MPCDFTKDRALRGELFIRVPRDTGFGQSLPVAPTSAARLDVRAVDGGWFVKEALRRRVFAKRMVGSGPPEIFNRTPYDAAFVGRFAMEARRKWR